VVETSAPVTETDPEAVLVGLVRGDLSTLPEVLSRHRVLLLVLFGSTAKGKRHPNSDLDLAVLFDGPPPEDWMDPEIHLEQDLDDLLQPTCEMQLVALNRASELLQKEVADHGLLLYEDQPGRWMWYRIKAYRRYEDTEKYRRRRWNALLRDYGLAPE